MGFLAGFDHKTYWGLPVTKRMIYVDVLSRLHNGSDDYHHHGVTLSAGQCLVTRQTLANSTGLKPKTVSAHLAKMPMFHTETVTADVSGHRALRITYLLSDAHFRGIPTGNTEGYTGRQTEKKQQQNTKNTTKPDAGQSVTAERKVRTGNTQTQTTGNTGRYTERKTLYLQGLCYKLNDTIFKNKNVEFGNFMKVLKRFYGRTQSDAIRTRFGDGDRAISIEAFGGAFEWWVGTIDWDSVDNPIGYTVAVWDQKDEEDTEWDHPVGQYNRHRHDRIQQVQDQAHDTGLSAEEEKQNFLNVMSQLGGENVSPK